MTQINKIDLLKIDAKLQARKSNKLSPDTKTKFEDQLLQTVKQLENMGSEIDAMLESNTVGIKSINAQDLSVKKVIAGKSDKVVENISSTIKTTVKSAKNVAAEYAAMNQKKEL